MRRPSERSSWLEAEPPLTRSAWRLVGRLNQRARASVPVWVAVGLLIAAVAVWRTRGISPYGVTVVLRVTEPTEQAAGLDLGMGALRTHLDRLAFSSAHLLELAKRHGATFGDPAKDPSGALEALRGPLDLAITDSDFVEDRAPGDPPRSARVTITYRAATPELAWSIAHELAELAIGSTLEREQVALQGSASAAESALNRAQAELDAARAVPVAGTENPRLRAAQERIQLVAPQATTAEISRRAGEGQQSLHFEIVDPGRLPTQVTLASRLSGAVVTLLAIFLLSALFAGAFDGRVLDTDDLAALSVTPLGHLPALPAGPTSRDAAAPQERAREEHAREEHDGRHE